MASLAHGRLRPPAEAPTDGEAVGELARLGPVTVEQILTGRLARPVDYLQDHHEFVMVVAGAGTVEAAGQVFTLGPGEWMVLPAGRPHRLASAEPGTSWLAVRVPAPGSPRAAGGG
ncbi:MAG: cupin domain-containing protein [Acidimicrobiales bacterium]